ncbi:MAG: flagellar motor protein MotB [Rhodothermales bacterium]
MADDFNLEEDDEPTAPFWMATFSDMMTLLLTFFVMLVAMSEVEVKKFEEALSYFQGGTGMLTYESVTPTLRRHSSVEYSQREHAMRFEEVERYLQEQGLTDMVEVNLTETGLSVSVTDSVMFRSGAAELIEPSQHLLVTLTELLGGAVAAVRVEGHTDDRPIQTARYPSNWELSTARAASVVRFLLETPDALSPDRYTALGHGEHRPIASNETGEGRARNRRVDIFFEWIQTWPTP